MPQQSNSKHRIEVMIRALVAGDFATKVKEHISAGYPVTEVVKVTEGTEWRFVITNSGTNIEVETIGALIGRWEAAVARVEDAASHLIVHDMDHPDDVTQMLQIRRRTQAAHAASDLDLAESRIGRYLRAEDHLRLTSLQSSEEIFERVGFHWNGGDCVQEIWSEDHKRKYEQTMAKARERGVVLGTH